ncbi:MAG TPA: hypothetical protein VK348_06545 [Planctomycetota bacterium]|nr:hypothetical protein [Planctomycetota bacterium]
MHTFHRCSAAVVLLTTAAVAQFTQITSSHRAHTDARLSPDASHVAYRVGSTSIGVVDRGGISETLLHSSAGNSLSSFVWSLGSVALYFADGNAILSVPVTGGLPTTIAPAVAGSDVKLWCIDALGQVLFGTRRDAATSTSFVFRLPVNGSAAPVDVLNRPGVIDDVDIDLTGVLLLRHWTGSTPVPATFDRHDLAANTFIVMKTVNQLAESAHWVTSTGSHFVVAMTSPAHPNEPQIARIDTVGTVDFLADEGGIHLRPFYPGNSSEEIVFETTSPITPGATAIGMVPNHGGAVLFADSTTPLFLNGGATTGGLTIDAATTTLALCAGTSATDPEPQIYVAEIDEDIHVHPQLFIGSTFQIDLAVRPGEIGAAAVADGLTTGAPFTFPGLGGEFWLDRRSGHMLTVLVGIGVGIPVTGTYNIPFSPSLRGLQLWVQAVHFDTTVTGSFTHFGYYRVF